jgi:hypothetical protein
VMLRRVGSTAASFATSSSWAPAGRLFFSIMSASSDWCRPLSKTKTLLWLWEFQRREKKVKVSVDENLMDLYDLLCACLGTWDERHHHQQGDDHLQHQDAGWRRRHRLTGKEMPHTHE